MLSYAQLAIVLIEASLLSYARLAIVIVEAIAEDARLRPASHRF